MPRTVAPEKGIEPAVHRFPTQQERRVRLREVREWARETQFFVASREASRSYRNAPVWNGRRAVFVERDSVQPLRADVWLRKGSGAEGEARRPWACPLGENGNERGEEGLPDAGQRKLEHEVWTLEGFKARLAFWTITLSPLAARQLHGIKGGWSGFSRVVHRELTRLLKKAGLIAWWASVTEFQMRRARQEGYAVPHLHIVFVNKRPGKGRRPWVLTPADLDGVIALALRTAGVQMSGEEGGELPYVKSAGNVKRVKKDAGKYLGKYMTKRGPDVAYWNAKERSGGLYVNKWWHSSKALKYRGHAHQPVLHGDMAKWLLSNASGLEQAGLVKIKEFEADDFRPAGIAVRAIRRDGLEAAWALFRRMELEGDAQCQGLFPKFREMHDWGSYDYEHGYPSLSGKIRVSSGCDVVTSGPSVVPTSQLQADQSSVVVNDRIDSPVTQVVKESLELVYRKFHIPEPVFPPARRLRVKAQLELPLDLGLSGSSWDVGAPDSWDPHWDDPNWRGGPPR